MLRKPQIVSCRINSNGIWLNGERVFTPKNSDFGEVQREFYYFLKLDYPKFHKMDVLAKWGFLGSELLTQSLPVLTSAGEEEVGLIFANKHSTAMTDELFQDSYKTAIPSPALFVYTLPNIINGEISIRNKWYGESVFSILPNFDPEYYIRTAEIMASKGTTQLLAGWLEIEPGHEDIFMFAFSAEQLTSKNPISKEHILNLYSATLWKH